MIAAEPVADASTRLALMWVVGLGAAGLLFGWLHSRLTRVNRPSAAKPAPGWGGAAVGEEIAFPAPEPRTPTLFERVRGLASGALVVLRVLVGRGDRFRQASGKHTPTEGWSRRDAARHLAATADLSDGMVVERVRDYFRAAGLPVDALDQRIAEARAVGVAQVVERPSWEDINRKRAEQKAWLADPDRTGRFPLVPAPKDRVR